MKSTRLSEKEIQEVFDKLQIPNSKQTYEKFEVWEMQPTKKSTHSSTQLF